MRIASLVVSLLAGTLLLGAASTDGVPSKLPWWKSPKQPANVPADGVVPGILDGTWWKVKVNAKGFTIDPKTLEAAPATFKTTAYMQLTGIAPLVGDGGGGSSGEPLYGYDMYTEIAPDTWSNEYSDIFLVDGLAKNGHHALNVNTFLGFDMGTFGVAANHSGRLTIKVDDQGQLKSAKLKTLAGDVVDSNLDVLGGAEFYGSLKVTGTTVDVDDLPFPLI
jgi:hypothetical protein